MKFQTTAIAALTTLLSLSSAASIAAPVVRSSNHDEITPDLTKRESNNYCGDSSFENETTGGSPSVSDCQKIMSNIAGGGDWYFGAFQRTLAEYGTCAFGAEVVGTSSKIGNQDVIDLIQASIDQFQWNGLVGAKGRMLCDWGYTVEWGLYHT